MGNNMHAETVEQQNAPSAQLDNRSSVSPVLLSIVQAWHVLKSGGDQAAAKASELLSAARDAAGASDAFSADSATGPSSPNPYAADIDLMQAHILYARGSFRDALAKAYQGLAALKALSESGALGAAPAVAVAESAATTATRSTESSPGTAAAASASLTQDAFQSLSASLESMAVRAGERSTGFAWQAIFSSTSAANAASARYSMLLGQANAMPMLQESKGRLTKHLALCTITCDYALRKAGEKDRSIIGRIKSKLRGKPSAAAAGGLAGEGFISEDGPAFEVEAPLREKTWEAIASEL